MGGYSTSTQSNTPTTGPHLSHTQSDAVLDHFLAEGLEGIPGAIGLLIKVALKIERSQHLQATANERTDQRLGFANGFKSQTLVTRSGPVELARAAGHGVPEDEDWRVHFHVPLHADVEEPFGDTRDPLLAALDWLAAKPSRCAHLGIETYTWEVLPPDLRSGSVVDQLVREYDWTLAVLRSRGLA